MSSPLVGNVEGIVSLFGFSTIQEVLYSLPFRTVCRDWTGTQDARIGASSLYLVIALHQEWFDDDDNVVD
jgi:hypothetical protein